MIRELKAENDRLKKQLAESGGPAQTVKVVDEEAKAKMLMMQEQLEANQRAMADMEKSWEQKLAEQKKSEAEEEAQIAAEEAARISGAPHLVNLNEDPLLDRKVIYDIKVEEPLTCGRRNKKSSHRLQLGGTGIEPDQCVFVHESDGNVMLIPSVEKAMPNIKVNGFRFTTMEPRKLDPNDRIMIGPSAIFLFKNKLKETELTRPDTDEDPISFDDACDEVFDAENAEEKKIQEETKAKLKADADATMKALNDKID